MKYGRFVGNVLAEVFTPPEGFTIEQCFHSSLVFEEISSDALPGWVRTENGQLVDPLAVPASTTEDAETVEEPALEPEAPAIVEEPAPAPAPTE